MIINTLYRIDVCLQMSEFSHYQRFHGSCHWLNFNQSANSWYPARAALWCHNGLSEVVLHSGGAPMTSHNKHHGGCHVVFREWYKKAHEFIKKNQISLEQFYMGSVWHHLLPYVHICSTFCFSLFNISTLRILIDTFNGHGTPKFIEK